MQVQRARALEGLGSMRDPGVLSTLLEWTKEQKPTRARAAAASALAKLGDEVEACRREARERLCELALDREYRVQVTAINALGSLKDPESAAVLDRLSGQAQDGRCRRLAYEALQKVRAGRNSAEGLSNLREELESMHAEIRKLKENR
jgi:HEAT repeat protein